VSKLWPPAVKNHCPLQRRLLRGDKIGAGANSAGKTTLLKLILGEILM
jgi:ATPase subunit of ABC transporter with duplicated ATPase domains